MATLDNLGLMPYRRRIVVVSEYLFQLDHFLQVLTTILLLVGRPISVKQHDKPTTEEVREAQEKYIAELTRYLTIRHILLDDTANVGLVASGIPTKTSSPKPV